jgi:hypothetical protein
MSSLTPIKIRDIEFRKSNNNSITPPSLKALAAEVQSISPELVRVLVSFSENKTGIVRSATEEALLPRRPVLDSTVL